MVPKKRKRFSAFDDFPINKVASYDEVSSPASQPVGNDVEDATSHVKRIERLKPSQMMPDRFQPRRLLPSSIRSAFYGGRLNCYQAAEEWLALTKKDTGHRSGVDRLLAMGESFEEHGQIKPITGSWISNPDGSFTLLIETGERRFWAACLQYVVDKLTTEPLLRVEVVDKPTRHRQVLENRHAEPPTAVCQACEIAALILAELNKHPDPDIQDDYDYFRLARSQRMPAGLWDRIKPIMQLTRPRMVQLLNILQFPTPLLDLANRYLLPERVLREVLSFPHDQWEEMILVSIRDDLTSDQVVQRSGGVLSHDAGKSLPHPSRSSRQPHRTATSGLRRFANALSRLDEVTKSQALDEVADEMVGTGQAEGLMNLLDELARLINIRLNRN